MRKLCILEQARGVKGGSRGGGGDGLTSSGRQLSAGGGHTKPRSADQEREKKEIREEKEVKGEKEEKEEKEERGLLLLLLLKGRKLHFLVDGGHLVCWGPF